MWRPKCGEQEVSSGSKLKFHKSTNRNLKRHIKTWPKKEQRGGSDHWLRNQEVHGGWSWLTELKEEQHTPDCYQPLQEVSPAWQNMTEVFISTCYTERHDGQEEQHHQMKALCVLRCIIVLCYLPVGVWSCEPELHAAVGVFGIGGVLVRVGPDLFTHGFGCWENFGPLSAFTAFRALISLWEEDRRTETNQY